MVKLEGVASEQAPIVNILSRLTRSLHKQGIKSTLFKFYMLIVDHWFDVRYGTDTSGMMPLDRLTLRSPKKYGRYQATKIVPLKRLFSHIRPIIPPGSVLVDFGCGKGRVLMIASGYGFREVRGVEYAHKLCSVAIDNCNRYKLATKVTTEFRIIGSDAGEYIINPDENIFFLFNPFGKTILMKVLKNINKSLEQRPRKALLIYNTPRFDDMIVNESTFVRTEELNLLGYHLVVYSNMDHPRTGGVRADAAQN